MKIVIIAVGKTSTGYVACGVEEFLKRANRYVSTELLVIPDVKSSKALSEDAQKQQEGRSIIAALQPGDIVTLLDERGKELTSREFSSMIERRMVQGIKRLVFVIGGPYGFSNEVYERADASAKFTTQPLPTYERDIYSPIRRIIGSLNRDSLPPVPSESICK